MSKVRTEVVEACLVCSPGLKQEKTVVGERDVVDTLVPKVIAIVGLDGAHSRLSERDRSCLGLPVPLSP